VGLITRRLIARLAAVSGAIGLTATGIDAASGEARVISLYHIHTRETLTILYKQDGTYLPEAMEKIDWIMRDWRRNEKTKMDPATIDLLWEMHTELGSKEPISIICGYRSRGTNEMLRKTVGGQAKQSHHISGTAIDVSFPDVPLKQLRYSALIHERGGVGYYPTSGIPFVHVDSARVRAWPRLPRHELALLFPSGRTQHMPAEGGRITLDDVRAARAQKRELATEIAAFLDLRRQPKAATLTADANGGLPVAAPAPKPAVRLAKAPDGELRMGVGAPLPAPEDVQREAIPKLAAGPRLVAEPRLLERPAQFTPRPSKADRLKLDRLVTLASTEPSRPPPHPVAAPALESSLPPPKPKPAVPRPVLASLELRASPAPSRDAAGRGDERRSRKISAAQSEIGGSAVAEEGARRFSWATGWAQAPEYDDDHPEELSYRPFPLAPLMTQTASPDDPALAQLVHPDVAKTLEMIDDAGAILPMRLRPGRQVAELLWAQEFRGEAVSLSELEAIEPPRPTAHGLTERTVKTLPR